MISSPPDQALPSCLRPDSSAGWREPLDVRDLATRLETEGVTDSVAAAEFGFESAQRMAEIWLPRVMTYGRPLETSNLRKSWWREYWAGASFSLPLLCSCLSTLWLGFALWGGKLSSVDATAVGLGTVASFLLSGGIIQAMVRRGLFFATTEQPARCARVIRQWTALGALVVVFGAAIGVAVSEYWEWLPSRINVIGAGFCICLGAFWFASGALQILNRGIALVWINLAGIAIVAALHLGFGWALVAAQFTAIACCTGVAWLLAETALKRHPAERGQGVVLPSLHDAYSLSPYLLYGVLYYALLFSDRMAAWTAHTYADALTVQFRGDYETAVNFGLFVFVFLAGWVHCATAGFYRAIALSQREHAVRRTLEFRGEISRFYWRNILTFALLAAAAAGVALWIASATGILHGSGVLISRWSLAGFVLLVLGLWNVSLLFGLSNATRVVRAAAVACFVNVILSYVGSRLGGYEYAVFGFVAGAAIFTGISTMQVIRAFRKLDYCYFASAG